MTIIVIHSEDNTKEIFSNVIDYTDNSVTYQAGMGIASVYFSDNVEITEYE